MTALLADFRGLLPGAQELPCAPGSADTPHILSLTVLSNVVFLICRRSPLRIGSMFNFRPTAGVPGFRVGRTEDTPGFAVDPNGLVPSYDPGAPIGVRSSPAGTPSASAACFATCGCWRCLLRGLLWWLSIGWRLGNHGRLSRGRSQFMPIIAVKQLGYQEET